MYITTQHISSFLKCLTVRNSLLELLCLTTRFLSDLWSNYYYWLSLSLLLRIKNTFSSQQKDSCLFPLAFANSQSFAQVLHKFCYRRNIYFIRHFYFLLNLITTLVKSIVIVSVPSHVTTAIVTDRLEMWNLAIIDWSIDWLAPCGRISL